MIDTSPVPYSISPNQPTAAQAMMARALAMQADFQTYFTQIENARTWVRQRIQPDTELDGKKIINPKTARAMAIVIQCRSFYERSKIKIEVPNLVNTSKEDKRTSKLERFLGGIQDILASRSGFVYSDAQWHGLESGTLALLTLFNPQLARNRQFPFEITAVDPVTLAYEKSRAGLVAASIFEHRPAQAIYNELVGALERAKKPAFGIPPSLLDLANSRPTDEVEVLQYFDKDYHALWVNNEFVKRQKHFMGRVPIDIGYIYDMPSDRPEEYGKGIISPVLDLLQDEQVLFDVFSTDAEIGSRPFLLIKRGNTWVVEQATPGESYTGEDAKPLTYAPNHQLLQELAQMLNDQTEMITLPRSTMAGFAGGKVSGFAMTQMMGPLNAKLDDLKKYPELTFGEHYKLVLQSLRKFATSQMARILAPDDQDNYLNSFSTLTDLGRDRARSNRAWVVVSGEDVDEHDQVRVDMSPKLPQDEAAKMQQFGLAMTNHLPFEYGVRYVLNVEDPDEVMEWHNAELLEAENQLWHEYKMEQRLVEMLDANPEEKRSFIKWLELKGYLQPPEAEGAQDLSFTPLDQGQQQLGAGNPLAGLLGPGAPQGLPVPGQQPMPPGLGQPGMAPPALFGQGPSIAPEAGGMPAGGLPIQLGG